MKREELELLEGVMMKEVVRRRGLGGYSMEAEGALLLSEALLRVIQYLLERHPRRKKDEDSK